MAFKSKYRGDQIEALLDRVNSGESGGTVLSNTFLVIGDYNSDARNNFEGVASGNKSADYYVGVVNVGGTKLQGIATIYSSEEGTSFSFIGYPSAGEYSHQMVKVTCTYNGSNFNTVLDPIMDYKQDVIDDLDNIRLGANLGVTALQSVPSEYITETELSNKGYATVSALNNKVDAINGKQLSTEDFTTALKNKLEGLSNYDDTELSNALSTLRDDFDNIVSGDTTTAIKTFNEIIAFLDGLTDTQDLESIIASIERQIDDKMDKVTLAKVATSGSYNDLTNKPTIPASVTESTVSGWGFTKNTGTYSKPSGGIPKSDLASAVQTSLGKADTALQSYTERYKGTVTGVKINGTTKSQTNGIVDLGTVITAHQTLKTINGESIVGSGDITISGGGSSDANVMAVDTGDVLDDVTVNYATKTYVDGLVGDINSVLESIISGGNVSIFPITLTIGDNGQSAIDLFNYVAQNHENGVYHFKENEIVKYDSTIIPYFYYADGSPIYCFYNGNKLLVNQSGMVELHAGGGN